MEKTKQIELEQQEILRREKELEATVKRPAEAMNYQARLEAESDAYRKELDAKGKAAGIRLIGSSEAEAATARGLDVLIADTAGRLHTKSGLMDELAKIVRVIKKIDPDAPHEVLLVVDATTGQNALNQAVQFHQAVGVTGIALTKLDGTAKGGIVFAIADRLHLPIRFVGVGESLEDLRPFDAEEFVEALFAGE